MSKRAFSKLQCLHSGHENPLGLPRPDASPTLPRAQRGLPTKRPIPSVRHTIAISSAKGGVGKSTIAANLALSFARQHHRTGLLDTDIFGPSIPTLFNLSSSSPRFNAQNQLLPLNNYGVKTMSMGNILADRKEDAPVVWRGLMVMKALQQLLHEVDWGGLDILILDLPPGTGDTQLTITQQIPLSGAVIVSTPQDLALKDALKGMSMFEKVGVRVLGMVQNMSVLKCPHCGEKTNVFGEEGVKNVCEERRMEFLGDVELDRNICRDADRGIPTVVSEPESERAKIFMDIARKVTEILKL
ncbi:MAG: hypothetical protein LQ351_005701 [Letrouitia transgressa]|nr:MAG: hypothetical protein LQ351_005701 [Letrouitia transgressa]